VSSEITFCDLDHPVSQQTIAGTKKDDLTPINLSHLDRSNLDRVPLFEKWIHAEATNLNAKRGARAYQRLGQPIQLRPSAIQ
jgi:hypothetical protein